MTERSLSSLQRPDPKSMGRVAVLMGGQSAEREISIRSGTSVLAALLRQGVDAISFDPKTRPLQDLVTEKVNRVFIALHGRYGEDGTVQGALELLKIPYTGSGVMASSIAMDKIVTKRLWSTMNLPTPRFAMLQAGFNPAQVIEQLNLPIAVKPVSEGSSLGMTKVIKADELMPAYALAAKFDRQVMAEAFVSGREFTCALLELAPRQVVALPVIEIVAPEGKYDYQNKYFGTETRKICPAPINDQTMRQMQSVSVAAFQAIGCAGWARADLMWDGKGSPMLLEINTSPGMTDHSLVPIAAAQVGLEYDRLILQILSSAALKLEQQR